MPLNHLILCRPLLLPPSMFPSIRAFSNESVLPIRWPKYGATVSATVFPMNIQDWFPLGWTGLISMQSQGLSRVFSRAKFQKHQFFSAHPSSWSNSHSCTRLLERPEFWLDGPQLQNDVLAFYYNVECRHSFPSTEQASLIAWLQSLPAVTLNQIPYDYTVINIFKRLVLVDRVPEELRTEVHNIV